MADPPPLPDPDNTFSDGPTPTTGPIPPSSTTQRTLAKLQASAPVRFTKRLGQNALNKVEDIGIGLLGVGDAVATAGGGVANTAVSGVGAVGGAMETGVVSALSIAKNQNVRKPREVDTLKDVDISGTALRDLSRAIEVEKMKGTSNADSPLNTPWILMIFPVLPIAIMYTKTALQIALPPMCALAISIWSFVGWRLWLVSALLISLGIILAWHSIKAIEPLRPITMQADVAVIKLRRRLDASLRVQMPKIYKATDKILPPILTFLARIDALVTPKLHYSPLLAITAKINGWRYDPNIEHISILESAEQASARGTVGPGTKDRGNVLVLSEQGVAHPDGLEFDPQRVDENVKQATGALFEQYFALELCLRDLSEVHRKYTSVWVEWIYRGMVVDRSVIRDINTSPSRNGFGATFDDYILSGEVRLPLRADTTVNKGGFYDIPIKLVLKGRDGLPIYSNDGARRYLRNSPPICVIGEIELSALRIGVGTDTDGIVRSELRVPLHALGIEQYCAAVLRASARIVPVDNSSYSYRQMLSPLPNGEWTVRVNVFELRNLKCVDKSGSSDPYVSASVMGITKKTDHQRQTQSCMVNQLLFFSKICTGLEFEDQKIVIEAMDWNRLGAPTKIGVYTLDAKRMLELPGKELYRKWFALQDPMGGKRPAGFIKLSLTVVPPGDTPPHHDDAEDKEELSSAKLLKNTVLKTPKMSYQNWAVHITVGWADMLPRMSSSRYRDAVRGYVTFNYSGFNECKSQTFIAEAKEIVDPNIGEACRVLPQRRVIWNEEYLLPLTIINDRVAQEGIHLKLFHRIMPRLHEPYRQDQLIGQVNVSFEELFKNMTTAVVRGDPADGEDEGDRVRDVALMKPRYYNFYGCHDGPADAYDKGIAFRGRLLIGVGAKPGDVAEPFLRPCPPPPRPKLQFYKMDFSVLRATELSLKDGWLISVECRIGLYEFGQTIPKRSITNQCVEWDENCAVSIPNLQFPEDVEQIPDFFVTICARKPTTVAELEERQAPAAAPGDASAAAAAASSSSPAAFTTDAVTPTATTGPDSKENVVDESAAGNSKLDGTSPQSAASTSPVAFNTPAAVEEDDDNNTTDAQWAPKAFLRIPAKHLICGQQDPRWLFMDYPGNNVFDSIDKKVPGSLLVSASLSLYDPTSEVISEEPKNTNVPMLPPLPKERRSSASPQKLQGPTAPLAPLTEELDITPNADVAAAGGVPEKHMSIPQPSPLPSPANKTVMTSPHTHTFSVPLGAERSFTLRALVWQGRNLPAADESGLSDPVVFVSMGDQSKCGTVLCKNTVSPLWEELIEVENIKVRDGERQPNVNVLIYDYDGADKAMQYLGRSIIPCAELDTAEPTLEFSKWYPVFSVNPGVIVGEILADFQLIPTEQAIERPMSSAVSPEKTLSSLRISLVGLRDVKFLQFAAGDLFVECGISGHSLTPVASKRGAILRQRAYEANCNILDVLVLDIGIPEDLRLAPALNFYIYAVYNHSQTFDLVATACVPLEKWLSEHNRRLLTGESLNDDSFGMDAPVPERLFTGDRKYKFRRNAKRISAERLGASTLRLHEIKAHKRGEQKNLVVLQEKQDVLQVGFHVQKKRSVAVSKAKEATKKGASIGEKISGALAPLRAMKYQIADVLADLMPDVSMALGIEVDEDVSIAAMLGEEEEKIDYDGTMNLKKQRGYCPVELEADFSEPAYGEFLLFRGDNRALGNTVGRIDSSALQRPSGSGFPPVLPLHEAPSTTTLAKREKRRAALEGARPAVGKVKARLDLIETDSVSKVEAQRVQMTSLRSFGRIFVPTEVVVRVYVLRAIDLQQIGSQCNPYLTAKFYGGYPDVFTEKHKPFIDDDNPNFFQMYESRVKMPGGSVRIEVKDRVLPEVTLPVSYPMYVNDDGKRGLGIVHKEIPINVGKLGLGWSESIGETVIDLDARWYNSAWRSLAKTPVETRALYSEDSINLKGQLEVFVDIFDANEVAKRPKMFRPIPISKPPQELYELRLVVYKIADCFIPYKLANNDPAKLAAFYVRTRLGNRGEDQKSTDPCKYVADGIAEFNWRMKWKIMLPSLEIKPRLKLQIFDDTTHGIGDDQLCATADIKLRSLFDEIVLSKKPIMKKKQWIYLEHPSYPDVQARCQISLELTTAELASKKNCFVGRDAYNKDIQHQDYVLAEPFQPAAFSLYNPVPYFNYLIVSMVNNIQWQLATILLIFPFIPMFVQFVFMFTPWQWYAAGGVSGLLVFIRLMMVGAKRTARMQAEQEANKVVIAEEE